MANTFDYRLFVDEIPYSISVISTADDRKRIVVNKTVVFDDICAGYLPPRTDILYFPFNIRDEKIVISIDDRELQHKFNIYINGVSPIDGSTVYGDLKEAERDVSGGFLDFIERKWKKLLVENLCIIVAGLIALYDLKSWVFSVLFILLSLVATVLFEWFSAKNTVKKFNRRFKIKKEISVK